jgi:hypothetical protein
MTPNGTPDEEMHDANYDLFIQYQIITSLSTCQRLKSLVNSLSPLKWTQIIINPTYAPVLNVG